MENGISQNFNFLFFVILLEVIGVMLLLTGASNFKLGAGDMICFDNRRVLRGRTSFDPTSSKRWLRGCYMKREELWSGLRMAARAKRARQAN